VARWGVDLATRLRPADVELLTATSIDFRVIAFTVAVSVVTGVIFGLLPALQALKTDLSSAIKGAEGPASHGSGQWSLRSGLVALQTAFCLVLLIGAGLCIRSYWKLAVVDPGFQTSNLAIVRLNLKQAGYTDETGGVAVREIVSRLRALPWVASATVAVNVPFGLRTLGGMPVDHIQDYVPRKDEFLFIRLDKVGPDYFATLGVPKIVDSQAPLESTGTLVWANESFVRRFWPGQDPVGKQVGPFSVQGVVRNHRKEQLWEEPAPELIIQEMDLSYFVAHVFVRLRDDPGPGLNPLRTVVSDYNKAFADAEWTTMSANIRDSLKGQRFTLALLGGFALLALLLATLGIHGVVSYMVSSRTREIGIRLSLGADPNAVRWLIVSQAMIAVLGGVALGYAGAAAFGRLMRDLLYELSPVDPGTYVTIGVLLATAAFVACWLPARRATRIDPMEALRYE
jgi:predicted permease